MMLRLLLKGTVARHMGWRLFGAGLLHSVPVPLWRKGMPPAREGACITTISSFR
ncbi:hypothetical protein GY45DRAFT_1315184 [Cubamyces sp. BRFM 1775]|nr:hypothetical protein GY45DRAFT_1315184 [Cubamyces sp. BRFM 1775]